MNHDCIITNCKQDKLLTRECMNMLKLNFIKNNNLI